ncbi:MAG: hypothetical protein AABY93_06145 [Bacteroidota bacterium]
MTNDHSQNLVFENLWKKDPGEMHEMIKTLMLQINPGTEGIKIEGNSGQPVFGIKNEWDKVVGMSTARKAYIKHLRNYLYVIQITIVSDYQTPGLVTDLIMKTRDFLESVHKNEEPEKMIGILVYVENVPLIADGREAIWDDSQLVYIGNSSKGYHIRAYYFKGATIS